MKEIEILLDTTRKKKTAAQLLLFEDPLVLGLLHFIWTY